MDDTKNLARQLDAKAKEYQEKVGKKVNESLLAKTFWQAMDIETLNMANLRDLGKGEDISYRELKEFALQRYEISRARTPARRSGLAAVDEKKESHEEHGHGHSDDSLYSADKGKGKGKGIQCYNCQGFGHRAAECPTEPGSNATFNCLECQGKGHFARDCPSKGKSKGKNAWKGGLYGGKGGNGTKGTGIPWFKGKGWKGKGKGSANGKGLYALDSSAPENPEWWGQGGADKHSTNWWQHDSEWPSLNTGGYASQWGPQASLDSVAPYPAIRRLSSLVTVNNKETVEHQEAQTANAGIGSGTSTKSAETEDGSEDENINTVQVQGSTDKGSKDKSAKAQSPQDASGAGCRGQRKKGAK